MLRYQVRCLAQDLQAAPEQLAASCEAQNSQGQAAAETSRDSPGTLDASQMARAPSDDSKPQQVSCYGFFHGVVSQQLHV